MKKIALYLIPLCCLIFLFSCQRENPVISSIPEIELLETSALEIRAFEDSLSFLIQYTDGDGNLGTNDDSERNVFLIDNRINTVHEYRLQQLAPSGAEIAIQGTFRLTLSHTILTDNSSSQDVVFTIYVIDQAGQESNRIESPVIRVLE